MRYYWVYEKDQRRVNWLIFRETPRGTIVLRDRYQSRACPSCQKLHEIEALRSGIDPDVTVRASADIWQSADGFTLFSKRGVEAVKDNHIQGLEFIPLPEPGYAVAVPRVLVATDAEQCGVEFNHKCSHCGRYGETCLSPTLDSMDLSDDPLTVVASSVPLEKMKTAKTRLLVPNDVMDVFRQAKLTGATYVRAH